MSEDIPHRREHPRLRLGIEAILIGLGGNQAVVLQDLSRTGAKLLLDCAQPISQGVLQWMEFEAFGDITWRKGRWCGMIFEGPLSDDWLHTTRAAAPALLSAPAKRLLDHAREFALGRNTNVGR